MNPLATPLGTLRDRTQQFRSLREKGKRFSSASVYDAESTRLLDGTTGQTTLRRGPSRRGRARTRRWRSGRICSRR